MDSVGYNLYPMETKCVQLKIDEVRKPSNKDDDISKVPKESRSKTKEDA